jgi:cyclic pyranopterin phosphate synthase
MPRGCHRGVEIFLTPRIAFSLLNRSLSIKTRPAEINLSWQITNNKARRSLPLKPQVLSTAPMEQLSHVDNDGRVRMVDTGEKGITARRAVASAHVLMTSQTIEALRQHQTPKGDPLEVARLAGIMAAKRTSELIPLCHPLPLTHIDVKAAIDDRGVALEAEVSTNAQTGVEMEALTAVSVAALTIYDMCKSIEKGMTITDIRLEIKSGGKSGDYVRKGS